MTATRHFSARLSFVLFIHDGTRESASSCLLIIHQLPYEREKKKKRDATGFNCGSFLQCFWDRKQPEFCARARSADRQNVR